MKRLFHDSVIEVVDCPVYVSPVGAGIESYCPKRSEMV
jgi:hypothetical protein